MVRHLSQVAWWDGMPLGPEHFDAQAQYYLDTIETVSSQYEPRWGFTSLVIDEDALAGGTFVVTRASGIFPSGTAFSTSGNLSPKKLELNADSNAALEMTLTLACGDNNPSSPQSAEATHSHEPEPLQIFERVSFLHQGLRIAVGSAEEAQGKSVLPMARVRVDRENRFRLDPAFVPPCVRTGVSKFLSSQVKLVLDRALNKIENSEGAWQRMSPSLSLQLWFLPFVYEACTTVANDLAADTHPARLFDSVAALAGVLGTVDDLSPFRLPLYNHFEIGASFGNVVQTILSALDIVFPVMAVPAALEEVGPSLFIARGKKQIETGRWILAMSSKEVPPAVIPQLVKVASAKSIARLAASAVDGFPIRSLRAGDLPSGMERRPGLSYFEVLRPASSGTRGLDSEWLEIGADCVLGIYAPSRFFGSEIQAYNLIDA